MPDGNPTRNDQENLNDQELSHLTSQDNVVTDVESRQRFLWLNQEGAPSKGP